VIYKAKKGPILHKGGEKTHVIKIISPPSWGFDVPLATAFCKTFLLRMLNES
jgi:hypothetical protein